MPRRKTGIILAYDKSTFTDEDEILLNKLGPYIELVKVGLEAMGAGSGDDGFTVADMVSSYADDELGKGSMWDAKIHDIGTTVDKAIRNIVVGRSSIKMLTVHAAMSDEALNLANVACAQANVTALAVTVLTDIDEAQCKLRFGGNPLDVVESLAQNAKNIGIRGLVCSPKELLRVNDMGMITVIPGIRPAWAAANDQKRVMTPSEAVKAGADYIVIGRPILQPPAGMTPVDAAKRIRDELDEAAA